MHAINPTVKLGEDEAWAVLSRLVSTPTRHYYDVNTVENYIPNCIYGTSPVPREQNPGTVPSRNNNEDISPIC
jgi:hypothetical protein